MFSAIGEKVQGNGAPLLLRELGLAKDTELNFVGPVAGVAGCIPWGCFAGTRMGCAFSKLVSLESGRVEE
jgi:hypothetical protein